MRIALRVQLKWIDGARADVTLHAPRGLSLSTDYLYTADIISVRWFDRKTGQEVGSAAIPDSLFLNDVFATPDGTVYVTDSGLPGRTEGAPPNPVDAVYRVSPGGEVEQIAQGQDLHRPDGIWLDGAQVWIVAFGSAELYRIENGMKTDS
ncbi:MAG: hypothetical protein IT368_02610 [Candidatus Hydrogenedentes bacterium]|nr:hypothetical protein [Candidatus Hydrogenedentota bacterium]